MNTVNICNMDVQIKGYNGQRVVTLKDIDTVHCRAIGTASRNFRENKERFIKGVDYFVLTGDSDV